MKYLFLITGFVFGLAATSDGRQALTSFYNWLAQAQPYIAMAMEKLR